MGIVVNREQVLCGIPKFRSTCMLTVCRFWESCLPMDPPAAMRTVSERTPTMDAFIFGSFLLLLSKCVMSICTTT